MDINGKYKLWDTINTAWRTVFPRSWNIMESSKRPSKYYLYINFLPKKIPYFPSLKSSNKNFSVTQNKNFSVISKYHLSINFLLQKDSIFHPGKVQNKNISVISKYHLSTNFLPQNKAVFPIPKKFKARPFQ